MRMEQEQPKKRTWSRLAAVPLAVACAAVPLGTLLSRFAGPGPEGSPYLPWLILAALGTAHAILFRRSGRRLRTRFFLELAMFAGLAAVVVRHREVLLFKLGNLTPLLPELTPVIMLGFCWLWVLTFGTPDRAAFQRWGAALGLVCVLDLAVEAFIYRAAPSLRWIGDANLLAGLLLVCLCASLRPGPADNGLHEPDQGKPVYRALILAGLLATLSRTGLFAAAWVYVFFGRGGRILRASVFLACLAALAATFLLPVTPSDLARYVDYWLWAKSMVLFSQDPSVLIAGLPLNRALPFAFPPEMIPVWERVAETPALFGAHLNQVPSFWLRCILGWGAILPAACLAALFILVFRRPTRMGAGLTAVLFVQGMSTPLFYEPSTGAVAGLGLILALSAPRNASLSGLGDPGNGRAEPVPEPQTDDDPAREPGMRPL
ncbi:hypothetical protein BerOc1_01586 [Pseudodesulfovibrio hydrargyri]|uniref:O-Antigen ligase n=1 Tax=Pseudodesulfovibrio hydrargyri TaxID=2125990 RepID=A0A1J5MST0_9BACT|nr:hypothetical protein [Pseudodesulfovibrio hydrargyri]OIQ49661.1 hypothetical protein BerOc1_01586 [Pseudodesulfovibrio hydrargyri]